MTQHRQTEKPTDLGLDHGKNQSKKKKINAAEAHVQWQQSNPKHLESELENRPKLKPINPNPHIKT